MEQLEFETIILHLIRTHGTCRNIANDMIELAERFGWMETVKVGLPESYAITHMPDYVTAEYKGHIGFGVCREEAMRNLETILREQKLIV